MASGAWGGKVANRAWVDHSQRVDVVERNGGVGTLCNNRWCRLYIYTISQLRS